MTNEEVHKESFERVNSIDKECDRLRVRVR